MPLIAYLQFTNDDQVAKPETGTGDSNQTTVGSDSSQQSAVGSQQSATVSGNNNQQPVADESIAYNSSFYIVLNYKCHTSRHSNGIRPDSDPVCDDLEITLRAPNKSDKTIYEWYVKALTLNGRILIHTSSVQTSYREISFSNAVCYGFSENYDDSKAISHTITLHLKAEVVNRDIPNPENPPSSEIGSDGEVRGKMLPDDVIESLGSVTLSKGPVIKTEKLFDIVDCRLCCQHECDKFGNPFVTSRLPLLDFTLKAEQSIIGAPVYQAMESNEPSAFSLVIHSDAFSSTTLTTLYHYAHIMVVYGYVVEVEEFLDKEISSQLQAVSSSGVTVPSQSLLRVRMLVTKAHILGENESSNILWEIADSE